MAKPIAAHLAHLLATPDIGYGVHIMFREPFDDGSVRGVQYLHPRPDDGEWCSGYAPINTEGRTDDWDMVTREPLTLSPSLLCTWCGHHGFIRDGIWVPA